MECFFYPELNPTSKEIEIRGDEFNHFRALRIGKQDIIAIVNGKGLAGIGYVSGIYRDSFRVTIQNFVENFGELGNHISIAIGILENKERFEFAFEKAVELRAKEFFPIRTKFTQRKGIDRERLIRKGIAAIKQTKRSLLPKIHPPMDLTSLSKRFSLFDKVIVADPRGIDFKPDLTFEKYLVLIGPEGGFDESEINIFFRKKNTEIVKLGDFRLRTETAATIILGILHLLK